MHATVDLEDPVVVEIAKEFKVHPASLLLHGPYAEARLRSLNHVPKGILNKFACGDCNI